MLIEKVNGILMLVYRIDDEAMTKIWSAQASGAS
ncbi:hypothetical protein MMON44395_19955 [Mycolicibacterium monacense DSM 44395]|nr:hypothetical protein [Mycolicibacterium monacense DSM 44395]